MTIEDTLKERGVQYGPINIEALAIREIKEALPYNEAITPVQRHCLDMIIVKMARIMNGNPNYADNWTDIQGYAKLAEEDIRACPPACPPAPDI